MSFNDLNLKKVYIPPEDNTIKDFFIPTLAEACEYKRGTAYFSSQAVYEMTVGIEGLIKNGGKMKYIISPRDLSKEDIDAIHNGYKSREELIVEQVSEYLNQPKSIFEMDRLSILSYLIEMNYLDIKVAFPNNVDQPGIYHQKFGVIKDLIGNYIGFNGSQNETNAGNFNNNEMFTVYQSISGDFEVINTFNCLFDQMWNNNYEYDVVIDFPDDIKATLHKYSKEYLPCDIDKKEFEQNKIMREFPEKPESINLFDYQKRAVLNWKNAGYRGIFDLCTGAGKTYCALYGLTELLKDNQVFIIICCPYQHLVDQWCEDLDQWGFAYTAGYTGSKTRSWKKKLAEDIQDFNRKAFKYKCLITTNAGFRMLQEVISRINGKVALVVDEAHNFGAENLRKCLTDRYDYRLALSATIDRYNDAQGTSALYDFFGEKVISYTLEDAIRDGKLTRYYYYPILVNLTSSELEEYDELTEKIRHEVRVDARTHNTYFSECGKKLLIQRARVVAGAQNKLMSLKEILASKTNENHILIYCGAATTNDTGFSEDHTNERDIRQIDAVTKMLSDELNMKVSRFTSAENAEQRRMIISTFDQGIMCQALAAIKCLDEGVSIKSIQQAYILASSTNPREYIQRRGRVLRRYPGKDYAYIYDFVTLPRNLRDVDSATDTENDIGLIKRELIRVKDFAQLAENPSDSDKIVDSIETVYGYIDTNNVGECDDDECK